MFTVLSSIRKPSLYLIAALAVMVIVLLTFAVVPAMSAARPAAMPVTGNSDMTSDYFQRHPELQSSASHIKLVDLSQPARPMIIPLSRISNLPDYFQRHPELRTSVGAGITVDMAGDFYLRHTDWTANVGIPVTGSDEASDYFQRHPELSAPAALTIDMMRYRTRNQNLSSQTTDLSDYFLRH